jgi:hypothetical protein
MLRYGSAPQTTLLNTTVVGQAWLKNFQLGLGVDAITGQLRASAVKPFQVTPSKHQSPEFFYSLVQSESDLETLVSGAASGSYNLEGVTISASTSFLNSVAASELAVTLVAQVSVPESQYSLAPRYELSVSPGKDFRDKYGDYFVAGYRAASSLYVSYQCRFSSAKQRTEFAAKLAAEAPEVFSAEGSVKFEQTAKQSNATVTIRISAQGVSSPYPPPPPSGWTPDTIVSVLLPWFNAAMSLEPKEVYLEHYRIVDPNISNEVPISPNVFSDLSFLYNRFWLVRALFNTCPDFGHRLVEEKFHRLAADIEAYQASLPSDPEKIAKLTEQTKEVLQTLREINNRQVFYTQVIVAAQTEPAASQNFDADKGVIRWGYGYNKSSLTGVTISSISDSVSDTAHIGWREHTFNYRDSTKVVVGWDVVCNWDTFGGDWHKVSDRIIGRSAGDIYVKGDYDRGYNWTVVWYVVDASQYPAGAWTADAIPAALAPAGEALRRTG